MKKPSSNPLMKIEFSDLETIKPAEVPDYLLDKIRSRIESGIRDHFSVKAACYLVAGVCLIIVLNVTVLISNRQPEQSGSNTLESMHLAQSNNLYK